MTHPAGSPPFWLDRWATNQIGFHEGVPNRFLTQFWTHRGTTLVPLCGKSADLEWLAAQGPVVGVDLSAIACAAFFAERNLTPTITTAPPFTRYEHGATTLLEGDIFGFAGRVDAIWDRAALIALPPALRSRYAALLLSFHVPILLVSFVYDGARRDGPPFSVSDDEVRALFPGATVLHREPVDEVRWNEVGGAAQVVWAIPPQS